MQVDFQAVPYDEEIFEGSLDLNPRPHEIDHFAGTVAFRQSPACSPASVEFQVLNPLLFMAVGKWLLWW